MESAVRGKNIFKERIIQQRIEKREDIIKAYLENPPPDRKTKFCRFFIRGCCIFSAQECHYAHGVSDLIFKKIDLQDYIKRIEEGTHLDSTIKTEDSEEVERYLEREKKKHQPSLELEKSFKFLFDYQPKLLATGELAKPYTLEEINTDAYKRQQIRDVFHRELQQEFVRFLFTQYNVKWFPKTFIEKCLLATGWYSRFRKIINSYCCYEAQDPKLGPLIFQLPQGEEYDLLMEDCMVKMFKKLDLIKEIPIRSSRIQQLYRKYVLQEDPHLPDIYWYYVQKKIQLDDVLKELEKRESFIQKFSQAFNMTKEELRAKGVFVHEKATNIEKREQLIAEYKARETPDAKTQLCRFFVRGVCILDAKDCKYAHGVDDLKFQKIDIQAFENNEHDKKKEDDYRGWEKKWGDIMKKKQPSLNLEFTHRVLFEYQKCMMEQGILEKPYTIEQLDEEELFRKEIRGHMQEKITKDFVSFLFNFYGRKHLKRAFIDKCFQSIGWITNWTKVLDDRFCYEVRIPKVGFIIVKIPDGEDLSAYMEQCIIKIIKNNNLLDKLPISSSSILKYFYKDIAPLDPFQPNIHIFLRYVKKTPDQYLKDLQAQPGFIEKLSKECGKPVEELLLSPIFDSSQAELCIFMRKVEKTLTDLIEKSHLGFILFSRFEETVHKKYKKEIEKYSNNLSNIRRILRGVALFSGALIINLLSETYLFSISKFLQANLEVIEPKYIKKLNSKCHYKAKPATTEQIQDSKKEPFEIHIGDKMSDEDLNNEIDMKKIFLVDDEASLEKSIEIMKEWKVMGIDIEGSLMKNGYIELIQCGSADQIVIFDFHKAKSTDEKLHGKMMAFVKKFMEDPNVCKVFHDCRKDSLALHLFTMSCPVNVFDVSGLHTLTEHLRLYTDFKQELQLVKKEKEQSELDEAMKAFVDHSGEVFKVLEDIRPPGLNEILKTYNASHGINRLKDIMKKRFQDMPREYFLKRPIDKEILIYSARDVEDLVEMKEKIQAKLKSVLEDLVGPIEDSRLELLIRKVSKTYTLYGCLNCV